MLRTRRGGVPPPSGLGTPTPTGWGSVYKLFLVDVEYGNSTYGLSANLRYDNVSCCFPLHLDWVLGFTVPVQPNLRAIKCQHALVMCGAIKVNSYTRRLGILPDP